MNVSPVLTAGNINMCDGVLHCSDGSDERADFCAGTL